MFLMAETAAFRLDSGIILIVPTPGERVCRES